MYYICYGIYILIGIATTLWFTKVISTYDDKLQEDSDIVVNTLLALLVGLIWPVAWLCVALFAFAKRTYTKSKAKSDDERDERDKRRQKEYDQYRAEHPDLPKSTKDILAKAREGRDPVINLYEEDSTIRD